jgi:hypothetical protein
MSLQRLLSPLERRKLLRLRERRAELDLMIRVLTRYYRSIFVPRSQR